MREGGRNCLKFLKTGWNRKEGTGKKDFKRGDELDQGVGGALKRGVGPFLRSMVYRVQEKKP